MTTRVNIQFLRKDIFQQYFNVDKITILSDPRLVAISENGIIFNDDVENNDISTSKYNALSFIIDIIGISELLENKNIIVVYDDILEPFGLWVHLEKNEGRTICIIMGIEKIAS